MKIRFRVSIDKKHPAEKFYRLKKWFLHFRHYHPRRFIFTLLIIPFILSTFFFKKYISDHILPDNSYLYNKYEKATSSENSIESIEHKLITSNQNVKGEYETADNEKIRSDVGFADLRVLTLEDYFNHYKSPLSEYSDDFIEASEKYKIDNWQLLPAIAIAETNGCQTGESFEQKNCWGWGGAGNNRVVFDSFEQAIDIISSRMIRTYGNDRMNARDIQSTYCGTWCMRNGWKWAKGINFYVFRINDFGERYNLKRTNEIYNFEEL